MLARHLTTDPSTRIAEPSFADPTSGRIVVLADDLTGACDAAAAFIRSARSVRVWFGAGALYSVPETVQAFTTNSRSLSASRAAHIVSRAVKALSSGSQSLFFKKVDSACRGPIGAEVLAAHRALSTRAVFFAPAFPAESRIVRDGTLEIRNSAGEAKEIRLAHLFPITIRHRIAVISSATELAPALESGKTILICDSESQADLATMAHSAQAFPGLLYAGSAGLAQALAGLNSFSQAAGLVPRAARTLLIAGSPHPVTRLQLQTLDRARFSGVRVMRLGFPFALAARIRAAFGSYQPQALILTGGATALLAVRALEADSLILQGELAPGTPWGLIQGGLAHGCTVVTKSGGLGTATAFNDILTALQEPA
jgi:D-threonate/D-erythronate kinase